MSFVQNFELLTSHKAAGRRWVTKEQYIRYFMMCYSILLPGNDMTELEQRDSLEVRKDCYLVPWLLRIPSRYRVIMIILMGMCARKSGPVIQRDYLP
jgi:hypothetical protein